jgi:hypothetical protein
MHLHWINIIIILTIAATIIYICEFQDNVSKFLNTTFINVPVEVKCKFEEPNCMEGDIDGWSIAYGLAYFITGLLYPNRYLAIITIAVMTEILGPCIGFKSRYIMNPLIAISTYGLGSVIRSRIHYDKDLE